MRKNCIVSERKGIRAVCVLTPRLFSYSTLTSRLGRKKRVIVFLFCLTWELIFSSHESKRCWAVHRDQRINCDFVAIRAKQSGTVKTVKHSKNDYHECSRQVSKGRTSTAETLTRSGRKKSFTNRDRNALRHKCTDWRNISGKKKRFYYRTMTSSYKRRLHYGILNFKPSKPTFLYTLRLVNSETPLGTSSGNEHVSKTSNIRKHC